MKKVSIVLFTMIFAFTNFFAVSSVRAEEVPQIGSPYGVAIDANTGEILYEKNAKEQAEPASMTKVITALLIAENMEDGEKMKVTPEALATECSCYGVEEGEEITKEDAIKTLMIQSANDVAVMASQHIADTQEDFSKLMNDRAKQIGVSEKTNFVTPNGLGHPDHRVTAYDMALIMREAVQNEEVLDAMKAKEYTVKSNKKEPTFVRHDKISALKDAVGGKTGYTSAAGNTLVVYYEQGNKRVITVVMKAHGNQYTDSDAMAQFAFNQIQSKKLYEKNQVIDTVEIGKEKVKLLAKKDFYVSYKKGDEKKYEAKTTLKIKKSFVKKGEVVGVADIYVGKEKVGKLSLVADKDIVYDQKVENKINNAKTEKLSIWWAIAVPWLMYTGYLIYYNIQKRKKLITKN